MRLLCVGAFLGAALFAQQEPPKTETPPAQEPAPPLKPSQPGYAPKALPPAVAARMKERLREVLEGRPVIVAPVVPWTVTPAPEQPCSKVRNIMRPQAQTPPPQQPFVEAPARIKLYPIPRPDRFATKEVPLPAPSCDDVKR